MGLGVCGFAQQCKSSHFIGKCSNIALASARIALGTRGETLGFVNVSKKAAAFLILSFCCLGVVVTAQSLYG